MSSTSIFKSSSSEQRWITQVSTILEKEVKIEIDHPVSIFRVPTMISVCKPEAYVPQLIGLGPYHRFRPELYEMEKYKLAAASRFQQQLNGPDCKQLVNSLNELENRVRTCYHKYLDVEGETLAWIMAIDGLFLLEFLRCYNSSSSNATAHLVDSSGRKSAHGSALGDIFMLENQIPIFVLNMIQCLSSHPDLTDDSFPSMLVCFCKALSPLEIREDLVMSKVPDHAHLLDLLYHLIVPKLDGPVVPYNIYEESEGEGFKENPSLDSSKFSQVFEKLWNCISNLNIGFISKITKPVKDIISVSKKLVTSLPRVSVLLASQNKKDIKPKNDENKTPLVDEIMIPSVSDLSSVGIQFCPTTGGITTLKFDPKTKKLYLPVVRLNVNSEVIMRNLVAYEATMEYDSLVFTRYIELMNGIIDTAEDAKLLREKKIIVNSLKSDADVAQLFNGMSKSVRLTNVPFIDKTINDANKSYNNTQSVRVDRRMKNFVHGSWQILTIFAVVLLMLLMVLQSFCTVYSCPELFNTISSK